MSTTRRHGPGAWTANVSGSHHALAITYRSPTCQASERECRPRSAGPSAPNHETSSPHHAACDSTGWRWRRASSIPTKRSRSANAGGPLPVDPRRLVVLVVGVVVAALGATELVAHPHHRHPVRHRQQAPRVAQLAPAQPGHVGRHAVVALPPAVPRPVVVAPVAAAPAVGLVVLVVVGDEVVQREAVVAGDEVDALHRRVEQVGAALHPLDERRHEPLLAAQEPAHVVAIAVVPLHPPLPRPRPPDQVETGGVPRLGHHHDPSIRGPPVERGDEAAVVGEHGREVEAEPVDAEVGEPVERPQDEVLGRRRRDVEVVAAPRRLDVRAVGTQPVERGVAQPAQVVRRPGGVDLGRVVEHDVEPHLDVVAVGGVDEGGQLAGGVVTGGEAAVDGGEGERHVAPVAALLRVLLVHREQLDDRDPELGEPRELAREGGERPGSRSPAPVGQPAHVRLVDDGRTARAPWLPGRSTGTGDGQRPAPGVVGAAPAGEQPVVAGRERHLGRPRVEQHLARVEARAVALGDEPVAASPRRPRRPTRRRRGRAAGARPRRRRRRSTPA